MKIGLDLRFIKDCDLYSDFVLELANKLIEKSSKTIFNVYVNNNISVTIAKNAIVKNVETKLGSLKEQSSFSKVLRKDKNDLMIFFSYNKPVLYKKEYLIFVPSLKDIYYQDFASSIQKYIYLFTLQNSLKNASKIICFDKNTKDELIERLNLPEEKINLVNGFFPNKQLKKTEININLDIRSMNKINNDFILYSGGSGIEKNLDRLIPVFEKINSSGKKLDLVFMGTNLAKNISLRNLVIDKKIQNNIHFLGPIKDIERPFYYQEAYGIIFPSLYEPFPFKLNEAVKYNSRILASNLDNIKEIFGDSIDYFSPISGTDILNKLTTFTSSAKKVDYSDVYKKHNIDNTLDSLLKMIN